MKNAPRSARAATTAIAAPTMSPVLDFRFPRTRPAEAGVELPVDLALLLEISEILPKMTGVPTWSFWRWWNFSGVEREGVTS
jgi:hypothetical protein